MSESIKCSKCDQVTTEEDLKDWDLRCVHRKMNRAEILERRNQIRLQVNKTGGTKEDARRYIRNFSRVIAFNIATCPACKHTPGPTLDDW